MSEARTYGGIDLAFLRAQLGASGLHAGASSAEGCQPPRLHHVERCDSTQDEARRVMMREVDASAAVAPREGGPWMSDIVLCDAQQAGRGRRGRVWHSHAGDSLCVSFLAHFTAMPSMLSLRMGLLTALALEDAFPPLAQVPALRPRIKWPNDVLLCDQKCSGVLIEAFSSSGAQHGSPQHGSPQHGSPQHAPMAAQAEAGKSEAGRNRATHTAIIGIGLNVGPWQDDALLQSAHDGGADRGRPLPPTSVARALGAAWPDHAKRARERWLLAFLRAWHTLSWHPDIVRREVCARLAWKGERVRAEGVTGILRGIDTDGAALLEPSSTRPTDTQGLQAGSRRSFGLATAPSGQHAVTSGFEHMATMKPDSAHLHHATWDGAAKLGDQRQPGPEGEMHGWVRVRAGDIERRMG